MAWMLLANVKKIVREEICANHSRGSAERARSRLRSDSGERIRDHGDEQVNKPKIEHDKTNDEKEARYEELCVDHVVHQLRPLGMVYQ
jgi:hypothetical protein